MDQLCNEILMNEIFDFAFHLPLILLFLLYFQAVEMAPIRRFRLCRSRIGTIFFLLLTCALILFAVNYISSSPKLMDESARKNDDQYMYGAGPIQHELEEKDGIWELRRKGPVRKSHGNRLVYEEEEEEESVQVGRLLSGIRHHC